MTMIKEKKVQVGNIYYWKKEDSSVYDKIMQNNYDIPYPWYVHIIENSQEKMSEKGFYMHIESLEFDLYRNHINFNVDVNLEEYLLATKQDKTYKNIMKNHKELSVIDCEIVDTCSSYDSNTEHEAEELSKDLKTTCEDFERELLNDLKSEYEYITSPEQIEDFLYNNNYYFDKYGRTFYID